MEGGRSLIRRAAPSRERERKFNIRSKRNQQRLKELQQVGWATMPST
jgi:hypothetical protein